MTLSGSGSCCDGGGSEHGLPEEILAVIPDDPYEQLDLARKITSIAIASRVSQLEMEAGRLRQSVADKDRTIAELQEKLALRDRMFEQADSRLRTALEENIKLAEERDSLVHTSKKLARDLAKLETFKRQLMLSLNEDSSADSVDIRTYDQTVDQSSPWKDEIPIFRSVSYRVSASTESGNIKQDATRTAGRMSSVTPPLPPRLTSSATPKVTSIAVTPKGLSTAATPKVPSGATSPTISHFEGLTAMSPWYPSSKQSSAANSPPRGRMPGSTPRVDGKEFFRQARSRLSYEQFGAFLANIKELNAHRQSREETLEKAEKIFGADNKDLYLSFQGLLNRNPR